MQHISSIVFSVLVSGLTFSFAADQPNIILMMGDDMGYSDIGCYGSEIETPNLDALAKNGLRFTQFYNTARCCPTRASLLSGLYPHQAGVGHMMSDRGVDGYRGNLNKQCMTIAEVLGTNGYRTYMAGKWHITKETKPDGPKVNWPVQRGFNRFYGTIHGAGSFFDPNTLTRQNTYISPYADPGYKPKDYYYTDAISAHTVRYISDHVKQHADQPFFIYVAYTAAHWPMHALPKDIAKYKGKYDAGYKAIREARYKRMLELGVIEKQWKMSPQAVDWNSIKNKEWEAAGMEVDAAMVDNMDQGIGRIVQSLKDTGQLEKTLICFFQDNGGCAENYGRGGIGGPRTDKPNRPVLAADYLQPDMTPKQSRDGYAMRTGKGSMAGPADTAIGYGRGWATVSNTPFREYKHYTHEGGISTPLIVHWPDQISRRGELEMTPGHLVDLMATAVDVAGAQYPEEFHDGQPIKPMEGKSLSPVFHNKPLDREAIYWEHEGNRAIRVGKYKLVAKGVKGKWELYNIDVDRSEQNDLSIKQPFQTQKMAALWQAYAERANVLPLNPKSQKSAAANRDQKRFELKHGDQLSSDKAPFVQKRGFDLTVKVNVTGDGVIAAQGGSNHGWALYVQEGTLRFATSVNGKQTVVDTQANANGELAIQVSLAKNGRLRVTVGDQQVADQKLGSSLSNQPQEPLEIGSDSEGVVGKYEQPFSLQGKVEKAIIEIK